MACLRLHSAVIQPFWDEFWDSSGPGHGRYLIEQLEGLQACAGCGQDLIGLGISCRRPDGAVVGQDDLGDVPLRTCLRAEPGPQLRVPTGHVVKVRHLMIHHDPFVEYWFRILNLFFQT